MFQSAADADRLAALARTMASDSAWGSEDVRKLILNASGRIEAATGDLPGIPLQGVHSPNPTLDSISDRIAAEYDCPLDEHRALLREIELLTNTLPAEVRKGEQPVLTTKSSKWRTFSREAVPRWSKRLSQDVSVDELLVLAVAIDGDQLLFEVCRRLKVHNELTRLMRQLERAGITATKASAELISILGRMLAYNAPRSRPAFDRTVVAAAKSAKHFWTQHRGNATVEFDRNSVEPKSEFAKWFCAVMIAAGSLKNIQCRSLLDKHV